MTLGPFDLMPDQVERLGTGFSEFVNLLIEAEAKDQGLSGHLLTVTSKETTADGGVDARLRGAAASDWLPAGDSSWQFKRANIFPKKCAEEIAGASWAKECIKDGGSYVLAIGFDLNDKLLQARRKKIVEQAIADGVLASDDPDRIRVYGASELARWASRFPALTINRLVRGPGTAAIDHSAWAALRDNQSSWVADESRQRAVESVRSVLRGPGDVELRVEGESGRGKTRLVLEALRDPDLGPLVAYVAEAAELDNTVLSQLLSDERSAILVVDECSAERHIKIAARLPADPRIRLLTIGQSGGALMKAPVLHVDALPGGEVEAFLRKDYPALRAEGRRFVTEHAHGNIRMAIVLAERVRDLTDADAASIISQNDVEALLSIALPGGADFFFASALSLFERIGWDRELRPQLEILADFAGTTVDRLIDVGRAMEQDGLLVAHGRFRAVEPHPLAVVLASACWRTQSQQIVDTLLPRLDEHMALSLFRRAADLGRFQPAAAVLPGLLSEEGPFGSLKAIAASNLGPALTQLAIVLPDEVIGHIGDLIERQTVDALHALTAGRRDLVWTLEKLAWHTRTFETAADALLRLALAENETWSNNATGTWQALFPTWLPATAAPPVQRRAYLATLSPSPDPAIRLLVVRAARSALQSHQSVMVSAEIQGGVLVEPRGHPETYEDAAEYQIAAISLLAKLREDADEAVARESEQGLLDALRPFIGTPLIGPALSDVLLTFRGASLQRLRANIADALNLEKAADQRLGARALPPIAAELNALRARLPAPTPVDSLWVLLQTRRWDLGEGDFQQRVDEALRAVISAGTADDALNLLLGPQPAAAELGKALGRADPGELVLDAVVAAFPENPAALIGYLDGLTESGNESAYDDLLRGPKLDGLDKSTQLQIAARGPATPLARKRILQEIKDLPVAAGVGVLYSWRPHLSEQDIGDRLDDWLRRVETAQDYSSLLEWVHSFLYNVQETPAWLEPRLHGLVLERRNQVALTNHGYVWCQLALLDIPKHAVEVFRLLLDLNEDGGSDFMIHKDTYDSEVLVKCATTSPEAVWLDLVDRLAAGSWRTELVVRGWLSFAFPSSVVESWVGTDIDRARLVAEIASVGEVTPTELASFLLGEFPDDEKIEGSLSGDFISGSWMGPESARLSQQITNLQTWVADRTQPDGVRGWARRMIVRLKRHQTAALEREAEEQF